MTITVALTSDLHRGFSDKTHLIHEAFWAEVSATPWDVLVLAGDLASHNPDQLDHCLALAFDAAAGRPVVWCLGNHDWWHVTRKPRSVESLLEHHRLMAARYPGLVDRSPTVVEGVLFGGWSGWWWKDTPDSWRMPLGAPERARDQAWDGLQRFLQQCDERGPEIRAVVAVTHFPLTLHTGHRHSAPEFGGNPGYFEPLRGRINVLCYGHTHAHHAGELDGVRLYNAGSDYNLPKLITFEI